MIKWLTDKEFKYVYQLVPRVVVDIILITPSGLLLAKRSMPPYKGMYHIIGSTVHLGESLEEAVRRTILEEAGVRWRGEVKKLGVWAYTRKEAIGQTISIVFLVKSDRVLVSNGKIVRASEVRFFKDIPKNLILPHRRMLKAFAITLD